MKKLSPNVIALGFVSFFNDVASEMIMVLLPLFLRDIGATKGVIGLIEGVADATSSIFKIFAGWISDKFGKKKLIIGAGYTVSTVIKPFIAIASGWPQVLFVRFADRFGKGFRNPPRDALIADSTETGQRGYAFGFHRTMDTFGAVGGTLLASLLLYLLSTHFKMDIITQYRTVFWFSFIPGIISVLIVVFFVKDLAGKKESIKVESAGAKFSKPFLFFLAVMAVFSLAYFSYAIFILRAADLGVAIALIPIIYLAYNLVYAGLSLPMGKLSDKIGRKNVLLIGFLSFSVVSCGFAFSTSAWQAWALFLAYGFTASIVDSIPRAMVADLVEKEYLGRAYGIYYTVIGIAILPASAFAGRLWDIFGKVNGPIIAFNYGAITAFIAAVLLYFFIPDKRDAEKINSR